MNNQKNTDNARTTLKDTTIPVFMPDNAAHYYPFYFCPDPTTPADLTAHQDALIDGYLYGLHVTRTFSRAIFIDRKDLLDQVQYDSANAAHDKDLLKFVQDCLYGEKSFDLTTNLTNTFIAGYQLAFHVAQKYDRCLLLQHRAHLKAIIFDDLIAHDIKLFNADRGQNRVIMKHFGEELKESN